MSFGAVTFEVVSLRETFLWSLIDVVSGASRHLFTCPKKKCPTAGFQEGKIEKGPSISIPQFPFHASSPVAFTSLLKGFN